MKVTFFALIVLIASFSCSQSHQSSNNENTSKADTSQLEEVESKEIKQPETLYSDTSMVKLQDHSSLFVYDMRYATDSNFLHKQVYECTNCLVRYAVAKALIQAAQKLQETGHKIKFFDCTRPVSVQKQMWEIMPDGRYVANPYKSGSIHNRGAAIDITLVDKNGSELDMGTGFDHFGEEAHHAYSDLSQQVMENRKFLKETMESAGFTPISTEWWHYNYGQAKYSITSVALCD